MCCITIIRITRTIIIGMTYMTIAIKPGTKKRLDKHGNFKESYDKIINKLLDHYEGSG
jgi:hypothetical protein